MCRGNLWTEFVREEAEARDFPWAYWEFAAGFGAYNRFTREWNEPIYSALAPERTGDFDGDTYLRGGDVNALVHSIVAGDHDAQFDINGDLLVDHKDLTLWLIKANITPGDADLDGFVDVSDFNIWNVTKFTSGGGWTGGDFNADGVTDVSDFNIWNDAKFGGVVTVPEPATNGSWLALSVLLTVVARRRNR